LQTSDFRFLFFAPFPLWSKLSGMTEKACFSLLKRYVSRYLSRISNRLDIIGSCRFAAIADIPAKPQSLRKQTQAQRRIGDRARERLPFFIIW
jgi:hypothetical protein